MFAAMYKHVSGSPAVNAWWWAATHREIVSMHVGHLPPVFPCFKPGPLALAEKSSACVSGTCVALATACFK